MANKMMDSASEVSEEKKPDHRCAMWTGDHRCEMPGSISFSTHGGDDWYCRFHYLIKNGTEYSRSFFDGWHKAYIDSVKKYIKNVKERFGSTGALLVEDLINGDVFNKKSDIVWNMLSGNNHIPLDNEKREKRKNMITQLAESLEMERAKQE